MASLSVCVMVISKPVTPSISARRAAVPETRTVGLPPPVISTSCQRMRRHHYAHALHHCFLASEASGKTAFGLRKAKGVVAFVFGKAPLSEAGVLLKYLPHPFDVGEVDAQSDDPHEASESGLAGA